MISTSLAAAMASTCLIVVSSSFWTSSRRDVHVVLGDDLVLLGVLEHLVGLTADVAHRHAGFFRPPMHLLDQRAAAFFGQRRHHQTDDLAVVGRSDAQIRLHDRLLDRADVAGAEGLDGDQARLWHADSGQLIHGGRQAVVLDRDVLHQCWARTTCTDRLQVVLHGHNRFFQAIFGIQEYLVNHGLCSLRCDGVVRRCLATGAGTVRSAQGCGAAPEREARSLH